MRFLCDVHISIRLCKQLVEEGYDCRHVNQLPRRWTTPDDAIALLADQEDRVLISKDSDFRNSCILKGSPRKLIKVNLGNISHKILMDLVISHLRDINQLNEAGPFLIELDRDRLSVIDLK